MEIWSFWRFYWHDKSQNGRLILSFHNCFFPQLVSNFSKHSQNSCWKKRVGSVIKGFFLTYHFPCEHYHPHCQHLHLQPCVLTGWGQIERPSTPTRRWFPTGWILWTERSCWNSAGWYRSLMTFFVEDTLFKLSSSCAGIDCLLRRYLFS